MPFREKSANLYACTQRLFTIHSDHCSKLTIMLIKVKITCPLKVAYAKDFIHISRLCLTINPEYIEFSYSVCEFISLSSQLLIWGGGSKNKGLNSLTIPVTRSQISFKGSKIKKKEQKAESSERDQKVVVSSQWRFWRRDPGFFGHCSSCTKCDRPKGNNLDPLLQMRAANHTPATQS